MMMFVTHTHHHPRLLLPFSRRSCLSLSSSICNGRLLSLCRQRTSRSLSCCCHGRSVHTLASSTTSAPFGDAMAAETSRMPRSTMMFRQAHNSSTRPVPGPFRSSSSSVPNSRTIYPQQPKNRATSITTAYNNSRQRLVRSGRQYHCSGSLLPATPSCLSARHHTSITLQLERRQPFPCCAAAAVASQMHNPFAAAAAAATASFHTTTAPIRSTSNNSGHLPLHIHESVQQALAEGRPIVALESTIVAHGMPYPQNLDLTTKVANILRSKGVEPATMAIRNATCRVGLSPIELEDLARAKSQGRHVQKCSTRELSLLLAQHQQQENDNNKSAAAQWGATTVASTMVLAHLASIPVFVTGGIGGVHRHGHETLDISADLTELARTPVVVVSAGIKSILDIPRTLEVLETNGVPVVAYQTNDFPAFFSATSNVAAPARLDDAADIAAAYQAARDLQLEHGMLVAVPNPTPAAGERVEEAIQTALHEAQQAGIVGQAVTPFVLQRVAETTQGESLQSNMELVEHNATVGADIAIALADLLRQRQTQQQNIVSTAVPPTTPSSGPAPRSTVIVMGGMVLDIVARPKDGQPLLLQTSNPATCYESDGGVGRNVAEVLGRLGSRPVLYSAVGQDSRGRSMLQALQACGVQAECGCTIQVPPHASTATYLAVLEGEDGDLHTACADMDVLQHIGAPPDEVLNGAKILVVDANASLETLRDAVYRAAHKFDLDVFLEPTSVPKAMELAHHEDDIVSCLSLASPNVEELCAMADGWSSSPEDVESLVEETDMIALKSVAARLLQRMNPHKQAHLLVTMGSRGVLWATRPIVHSQDDLEVDLQSCSFHHFAADQGIVCRNATGAGDSFTGAFVHSFVNGHEMEACIRAGMDAAKLSLECSNRAVSDRISFMRSES